MFAPGQERTLITMLQKRTIGRATGMLSAFVKGAAFRDLLSTA